MSAIRQAIEVLVVCSFFMAVGPALMVVNKEILDTVNIKLCDRYRFVPVLFMSFCFQVGFRYPILVSWLGLAPGTIMIYIMRFSGNLELKHQKTVDANFWCSLIMHIALIEESNENLLVVNVILFNRLRRCLPVGVCHAGSLCFGNMQVPCSNSFPSLSRSLTFPCTVPLHRNGHDPVP